MYLYIIYIYIHTCVYHYITIGINNMAYSIASHQIIQRRHPARNAHMQSSLALRSAARVLVASKKQRSEHLLSEAGSLPQSLSLTYIYIYML